MYIYLHTLAYERAFEYQDSNNGNYVIRAALISNALIESVQLFTLLQYYFL